MRVTILGSPIVLFAALLLGCGGGDDAPNRDDDGSGDKREDGETNGESVHDCSLAQFGGQSGAWV